MTDFIMDSLKDKVYVGIDVHKRTYSVTALGEKFGRKTASMSASPTALISFLEKHFSTSEINTAYEAGFSGFHLHRQLVNAGIKNIVINPAAMEVAANQRVKTDKKDSQKLAEHLSQKRLKEVRVPGVKEEYKRLLTRTRDQLTAHKVRTGNQIKSKLFLFGFIDFNNETTMSAKYLENLKFLNLNDELKIAIDCLADVWLYLSEKIKKIDLELKKQAQSEINTEAIYRSVPGIGPISSRILSNELTMAEVFNRISLKRGKKRAIIAVARRLIGKIRACFKQKTLYKIDILKEEEAKNKED